VSPELFSLQLKFLKDHFDVITLGEAVSRLSTGVLNGKSCVITFDDGYRDNYQFAAPLLAEYNLPATIFITYNAIQTGHFGWGIFDRTLLTTTSQLLDLQQFGLDKYSLADQAARELAVVTLHRLLKKKPDVEKRSVVEHVIANYGNDSVGERIMMNWEEVSALADSGLVTIGAHTISHPILSRVSESQARYEIIEGKHLIEQKLGQAVDYFAYPNGQPEDIGLDVVALVKEAGYLAASTTVSGRNVSGTDVFELKRIDVTNSISTDAQNRFSPALFAFSLSGLLNR
jgi:peptidoglycan/xylan/chitin deacetylase (PgdA/CDA1 family)